MKKSAASKYSDSTPSAASERQQQLKRLRAQDFLARTGDRSSIVRLLESIGDNDPELVAYSLDKVFHNPAAYQELMQPESLVRMRVIHAFSENDPERAVRFSIDSLAQKETDLQLLALDVLDCNIAYLEAGIEIHLNKLLFEKSERVQVKAARLLVLLSNYIEIDLSNQQALGILEQALDSPDLYCRQTAYGMPASIFYKIKNVKSTIEHLRGKLQKSQQQVQALGDQVQELRAFLRSRDHQEQSYSHLMENIEEANRLLREQMGKYEGILQERDHLIHRERQSKADLLQALIKERKSRSSEVEHARSLYESLVDDFQTREDKFKHQAYDFYQRFREMFLALLEEKETLLDELSRQTGQDGSL